ncbi:MAG: hypothetical protein Q4A97_06655 [Comamonadaceae bacterium]|nr:hypothetical protein [Comamonadaceae bacterium]
MPSKIKNNFSASFLDMPIRMKETWEWTCSIVAFDYGDPEPLAKLILTEPIPEEFLQAISEIVANRRQPNLKAATKTKIPASERMKIAGTLSLLIGLRDKILSPRAPSTRPGFKSHLEEVADRNGQDPIDVIRELQSEVRGAITDAAVEFSVSEETIENILREFKGRIRMWPAV